MASARGIMGAIFAPSIRRASAGVPSYGMIPPLGSVQSASGMLVSQATAMSVSTVYACVRRRAVDVARCKPSLYRMRDDGSREVINDHPVNKLFRAPNRQQNWFEWMEQMEVAYLLRGNAYSPIRRDRRGDPIELIPVNPDAVMVLEGADGGIFYNVNRIGLWQIAMLRDFPVAIPEEEMMHLRGLTFNSLVGVSTIGLARDSIGLAIGQDQQASRWVGNGARPAGVLESPKKLSEDAAKRLKASWDALTSGIQNVGRTAVLEEGVAWKPMQLSSVDIEFIQQRNFTVLEICRFFGVPPHKIGADSGTRSASMNISQQDQDYVNSTVMQDLVRWEDKLETVLDLKDEGIFVDLDETQLLRADIMTRRNAARIGILSALTTSNEERRGENLPPMPGGDVLLVPSNTAALGSDMTGEAADGAGRPAAGNTPSPGVGTSGDQPTAEDIPAQNSRTPRITHAQKIEAAPALPAQPITLNVDARRGGRKIMHMRKALDGSVRVEIEETEEA